MNFMRVLITIAAAVIASAYASPDTSAPTGDVQHLQKRWYMNHGYISPIRDVRITSSKGYESDLPVSRNEAFISPGETISLTFTWNRKPCEQCIIYMKLSKRGFLWGTDDYHHFDYFIFANTAVVGEKHMFTFEIKDSFPSGRYFVKFQELIVGTDRKRLAKLGTFYGDKAAFKFYNPIYPHNSVVNSQVSRNYKTKASADSQINDQWLSSGSANEWKSFFSNVYESGKRVCGSTANLECRQAPAYGYINMQPIVTHIEEKFESDDTDSSDSDSDSDSSDNDLIFKGRKGKNGKIIIKVGTSEVEIYVPRESKSKSKTESGAKKKSSKSKKEKKQVHKQVHEQVHGNYRF